MAAACRLLTLGVKRMANPAKNGPGEADFLAHEAEVASAAIGKVKTELLDNLKRAADPKAWAEKYPLPALGTAAVGGFAAAAVVKPMVLGSSNGHHHGQTSSSRAHAGRSGSSTWKRMLAPLLNVAKSSIKSAIIAGITAKAATDSVKDEESSPESPADAANNPYASATTSASL